MVQFHFCEIQLLFLAFRTRLTLTFVLNEKIEEVKRLLRYTDKFLNAVAVYLGFSSQSHFANTFREYAGKSPSEFRKLYGDQ